MKVEKNFSNDEIKQLWDTFGSISQEEMFQCFNVHLSELNGISDTYKEFYESLSKSKNEDKNNFACLSEFNQSILKLLLESQEKMLDRDFSKITQTYLSKLSSLSLNKTIIRREKFSPYVFSKKDKLSVFLKKLSINSKFTIKVQRRKFFNIFRRIFKMNLLGLDTFQTRKIPYKYMVDYYFGIQLPKQMANSLHEIMQIKSIVLLDLWRFDNDFDTEIQNQLLEIQTDQIELISDKYSINEVIAIQKQRLNDLTDKLKNDITLINSTLFDTLDQALLRVDTPEMPRNKFQPNNIKAEQNLLFTTIDLENQKWHNTHRTLLDDWSLDVEIVRLYFTVLSDYTDLHSKISKFIDEHLSLNIEQLREFISASVKRIQDNATTAKELTQVLNEERSKVSNDFIDKMLAQTIKKLSGSITQDIEKFNSRMISLINNVSDKRSFIKSKNYERGIRSSEINWLSPKELLNFEALPHFEASIKEIKQFIEANMKKARVKLLAMGTVSDFSLESAQIMLQNKKGAIKSTAQVAEEGLNRALSHLDEVTELMEGIKQEPQEQLHQTITTFNTEIQKLKNIDTILELNLQIVKIKAIERSKKLRKDAITWILTIVPRIIDFVKKHISGTTGYIAEIKKHLGVRDIKKVQISHELPEFIRQTELALKKLPFVYQRLYQLTPTDEDRFFVNRQAELESLQKAFSDWTKDRFVTTALISEKGNGATSLLKIFLNKIETDIPIIHQSSDKKIYNTQAYLTFFSEIFEQEKFESNEEIIDYLNNRTDYLILIIENLHHFFIKKVNGFECQKMLFELMSRTSKKVFWIASYTIHSWEYLKKTVRVSEHFTKEIQLQKFDGEMLDEVIFKRNNLSGYKIEFEPSKENLSSKTFQKMNDDDRQSYLRKHFFIELNQMSNGNVSLAQLYWLRSTCSVSDDTINISSLREIDASFVKDLPAEHLFAMHTILIHDGLNLEDYALSLNIPESNCGNVLIPMLEKGLLIRPKEKFNINPIIFRQVVSLLSSHNFIN
ncbi:hypothetical protein DWB61_10415 [Ancylomarina euxinus]|uniref:ATP-binding protein n=1 Tax=Ancylomarina euxinus TaxID=2283627 RepID=A0A425Y0T8_9BACT|nr:hypothetical protein [Ancylomarina euxinus]MCZ4695240.1 hypothetical protein [Ancylomarina euxinus]MUP15437.1 hypothetical protein [Ancylomarina euxinus]RRG21147.1 hypothetical protein DWB61_10415 [Ancylomarina euxinus]